MEPDLSYLDKKNGNRPTPGVEPEAFKVAREAGVHKQPRKSNPYKNFSKAKVIRRFLEHKVELPLDGRKVSRLTHMVNRMFEISTSKSPLCVQAFTALMDRAYGKPKMAEEDSDALAKGGIQIVYVAPVSLENKPNETKTLPAPSPDFIEAQFEDEE